MKQHATPIVIDGTTIERAAQIDLSSNEYNEYWLQNVIDKNSTILPIEEIEPAFSNQISICTELPTESGFCDNVLINNDGYITIVECKLWRNPEARRQAISQIIDYAKDISKWSFDKFEENCLRARKGNEDSIISIIEKYYPDIDERSFIDNTQRNLSNARFLLLLVGDGIRENAEELAAFLQQYGNLSFTLSLVEMGVYKLADGKILITPRLLLKTTEIIRSVIKIDRQGFVETAIDVSEKKASSNSERVFFERLSNHISLQTVEDFKGFINDLSEQFGITPKMGRGKRLSYNLKTADDLLNLASIQETGEVWFYGIVPKMDELGDREIGIKYLKDLAEIVDADFDDSFSDWNWCVRRNKKYLSIADYLKHKDQWKKLIDDTLRIISELKS